MHITGAILCLSFSTTFHLFDIANAKLHGFLSRLDYGGISLLIMGSAFPPLIYGYGCNPIRSFACLIFIGVNCTISFILTLIPAANTAKYMKLRGILFISTGLSAGIPAVYTSFTNDPNVTFKLTPWAIGGVIYILGALFYVFKIPERFAPGRFDIFVNLKIINRDKAITSFIAL